MQPSHVILMQLNIFIQHLAQRIHPQMHPVFSSCGKVLVARGLQGWLV